MKIIGLTGGIGSGKSTIAKEFAARGIPVYNSDDEAKKLIATNAQLRQRITETFGENAYVNGQYNKAYIAQIVFNDANQLTKLNAIVHPALAVHFREWVQQQNTLYVIKEAAILFESGSYKDCDFIISVVAPEDLRIARVIARDHCTECRNRKHRFRKSKTTSRENCEM